MGYNPRAEWTVITSPVPQVTHRLEQIREARDTARLAMRKAQLGWIRDKEKKHHAYQVGDLVWLDGRNIKTYHPTAKLRRNATDHSLLKGRYQPLLIS